MIFYWAFLLLTLPLTIMGMGKMIVQAGVVLARTHTPTLTLKHARRKMGKQTYLILCLSIGIATPVLLALGASAWMPFITSLNVVFGLSLVVASLYFLFRP